MSEKVATMALATAAGPSSPPTPPPPPSPPPSLTAQSSYAPSAPPAPPKAPPSPPAPANQNQGKQSPPPCAANSGVKTKTTTFPSASLSTGSVPTRTQSASSLASSAPLPPNVPIYTTPAILALPPTAVLTKQEMDFRANLLNPNNDLFWTARGLIRPPVLADALAQGHAILKHEGHLTQKQGGRRLSAQFGRSGGSGGSAAAAPGPAMVGGGGVVGFGTGMNAVVGGSVAAVQGSWRSAAPVLQTNPAFVTKEDMDTRANQLNPNNDVFWSSRGLIRPPVLADALAQGHAILQHEGHLTQTQTHKTRSRLNSLPTASLYANAEPSFGRGGVAPDARRSISGQGLPGSGARIGSGYRSAVVGTTPSGGGGLWQAGNPAMRRRASTTGSIGGLPQPLGLDSSLVTKDEVDLRANLMNPNNSVFWTSRGLTRPVDLQEALAKGHAVLEAEGHTTHAQGGRKPSSSGISSSGTWTRRGSRTEMHGPPAVSPLVAAAQRQWSTPFLAPNAGSTLPGGRSGGLPGAAWVGGGAPGGALPVPVPTRHPDWQPTSQGNAAQRRRYSLPPPGFELFTPPSHFGLFRPPAAMQQPIVREGAADSEWDKMDESAFVVRPPLAPHSAAIPIIKPPAATETAKKSEAAAPSAWVRKEPSKDQKKSASIFLKDEKKKKESKEAEKMKDEDKLKKKSEDEGKKEKKEELAGGEKKDVEMKDATTTVPPSEPTTPASEQQPLQKTKVGSLAWQLTQVKLRTAGEARESESASKSATV